MELNDIFVCTDALTIDTFIHLNQRAIAYYRSGALYSFQY